MLTNITITGKNFQLNQALKNYVTGKMKKAEKISGFPIKQMKAELDIDKNQNKGLVNRVELSVTLPGRILKAGHKAENMREAIDLCLPKLLRQIKKYKTITLKKRKPGLKSIRNY